MKQYLPPLAFLTIALTGTISAALIWASAQRTNEIRFAALAEDGISRITAHIDRHMLIVEATAAAFEARHSWFTRDEFHTYVDKLRLPLTNPGSVGMGYSIFAQRDDLPALARAYLMNTDHELRIWPRTGADRVAVAILFQSTDPGPSTTSGFDAYSDPIRREALDNAIAAQAPRATAPLTLVRDGDDPRPGFVIYAPVYASAYGIPARDGASSTPASPIPTGFVSAGFRINTLLTAAIDVAPYLPVHFTIFDNAVANAPRIEHGAPSAGRFDADYDVHRVIPVAGREWAVTLHPTDAFRPSNGTPIAIALGLVSVLLAAAAAAMLREQARAKDAAEALALTTQRNLVEKDLILQEMNHRIKNAITRILAIARQTAVHADSLESFTQSFTQRLQAMASAQDVLTRSKWQRADLRELLAQELTQVFGPDFDTSGVRGPEVELDERRTQALGLTFHELATNALKYGGADQCAPCVKIVWQVDSTRALLIDWTETGASDLSPPERVGFGSKLIDANIRHELGGEITREYLPNGLRLRLKIPLVNGAPDGGTVKGSAR